MDYYVITHDKRRAATWQRLFGLDRLPIKVARPRWQVGRGAYGETEILAYDLDAARLHPMARARFADYIARRTGQEYESGLYQVDGWPIAARQCSVVQETAVSRMRERPFLFGRLQEILMRSVGIA